MKATGIIALLTTALALQQVRAADNQPETCSPSSDAPDKAAKNYTLNNNDRPCIIVQLAAHVKVGSDRYVNLTGGQVNSTESFCPGASGRATLRVNFNCAQVWLNLSRRDDQSPLEVSALRADLVVNGTGRPLDKLLDGWKAARANHSYACESEQSIDADRPEGDSPQVSLVLSQLIVEAFRNESETELYQPQDHCYDDLEDAADHTLLIVLLVVLLLAIIFAVLVCR